MGLFSKDLAKKADKADNSKNDAFIYDAVRTPRGRGKADGSLHEVTALNLASQALAAIKDRTNSIPS